MSTEPRRFINRVEAGRALAERLDRYRDRPDVVVLALPRGGVPVAAQVAAALHAPLDVFVVRKLGTPGQPELAMGAIASGGVRVLNDDVVRWLGIASDAIDRVAADEQRELARRELLYRGDRQPLSVDGRTVIVVDDGLATGSTMKAAVAALRARAPAAIVVAVPVGARESCAELSASADEVVCVATPEPFRAVGLWYDEFDQTSDAEVTALLANS